MACNKAVTTLKAVTFLLEKKLQRPIVWNIEKMRTHSLCSEFQRTNCPASLPLTKKVVFFFTSSLVIADIAEKHFVIPKAWEQCITPCHAFSPTNPFLSLFFAEIIGGDVWCGSLNPDPILDRNVIFRYSWYSLTDLGRVVRKPINANPRLKVNRGFHLAR